MDKRVKCPKCGRYFVFDGTDKAIRVGKNIIKGTVNIALPVGGFLLGGTSGAFLGRSWGSIGKQAGSELAKAMDMDKLYDYKCPYCNHKW